MYRYVRDTIVISIQNQKTLQMNSNRNKTHDVKMAISTGCLDLAETSVGLGRIYTLL